MVKIYCDQSDGEVTVDGKVFEVKDHIAEVTEIAASALKSAFPGSVRDYVAPDPQPTVQPAEAQPMINQPTESEGSN